MIHLKTLHSYRLQGCISPFLSLCPNMAATVSKENPHGRSCLVPGFSFVCFFLLNFKYLFKNIYRANAARQTGIVLSSLGRATGNKKQKKDNKKEKQWSVLAAKIVFLFSLCVCLAERGWPLAQARDMPEIQRNEREAASCSKHKVSVWRRDVCYWKDFLKSCLIRSENMDEEFPARPVRAVKKTQHTLVLSIDLSSDLAFNEMRRRMNSFL